MTPRQERVAVEILRLAREAGLEGEPPSPDEPLAGKLDSLLLLSLVVAVEDRFRVRIADDEAAAATSLADLARLVADRTEVALDDGAEARAS